MKNYIGENSIKKLLTLIKGELDKTIPITRKINGKTLNADISLSASDVGAATEEYVDQAIAAGGGGTVSGDALLKTGDTMEGVLKFTENVHYGDTLPETGETGQIFFVEAEDMFLKKSGDTMKGDFSVEEGSPSVFLKNTSTGRTSRMTATTDNYFSLYNEKTDDTSNNKTALWIAPESTSAENLLRINHVSNGTSKTYKVLHSGAAVDGGLVTNATITRAKLANDALYSPAVVASTRNIAASDLGCTLQNSWNASATYTLTQAVSTTLPTGAEIAFLRAAAATSSASLKIATSGVRLGIIGDDYYTNIAVTIPDFLGMIALRKVASDNTNGDLWVVIGNVEVVS